MGSPLYHPHVSPTVPPLPPPPRVTHTSDAGLLYSPLHVTPPVSPTNTPTRALPTPSRVGLPQPPLPRSPPRPPRVAPYRLGFPPPQDPQETPHGPAWVHGGATYGAREAICPEGGWQLRPLPPFPVRSVPPGGGGNGREGSDPPYGPAPFTAPRPPLRGRLTPSGSEGRRGRKGPPIGVRSDVWSALWGCGTSPHGDAPITPSSPPLLPLSPRSPRLHSPHPPITPRTHNRRSQSRLLGGGPSRWNPIRAALRFLVLRR